MFIPIFLGIGGVAYNDVLALVSLAGCILLFIGSLPGTHRFFTSLGESCMAPLYFGLLLQVAMYTAGLIPERIGFFFPMAPGLVNGLFGISILLLIGRWWLGSSPTHPARLRWRPAMSLHNLPDRAAVHSPRVLVCKIEIACRSEGADRRKKISFPKIRGCRGNPVTIR